MIDRIGSAASCGRTEPWYEPRLLQLQQPPGRPGLAAQGRVALAAPLL